MKLDLQWSVTKNNVLQKCVKEIIEISKWQWTQVFFFGSKFLLILFFSGLMLRGRLIDTYSVAEGGCCSSPHRCSCPDQMSWWSPTKVRHHMNILSIVHSCSICSNSFHWASRGGYRSVSALSVLQSYHPPLPAGLHTYTHTHTHMHTHKM